MLLRSRTDEDIPGCVTALWAVHQRDGYPTVWPGDPAAWLTPVGCTAAWVAALSDDSPVAHVCLVNGAHPADADAAATATGVDPTLLATVSRLFVSPTARGRGLAASLVRAVTVYAHRTGLQPMLDVVDDGGPAVALYEREGWDLVHERAADWTTPEGHLPPVRVYTAPPRRSHRS